MQNFVSSPGVRIKFQTICCVLVPRHPNLTSTLSPLVVEVDCFSAQDCLLWVLNLQELILAQFATERMGHSLSQMQIWFWGG